MMPSEAPRLSKLRDRASSTESGLKKLRTSSDLATLLVRRTIVCAQGQTQSKIITPEAITVVQRPRLSPTADCVHVRGADDFVGEAVAKTGKTGKKLGTDVECAPKLRQRKW